MPKKNVRSFCSAKAPHNFSAKNITTIDFVSTIRLNKFSSIDFVKLTMNSRVLTLLKVGSCPNDDNSVHICYLSFSV